MKEQLVELEVYQYSKVAKKIPSNVDRKVRIRLIKKISKSGEVKVFATSLLDQAQYSSTSIINLYKQRWGVEEAYKTLKARLDIIHFSGKTVHAVQQDFYANVLLISLCSILKFQIPVRLKTKKKTQNREGRIPILNNSYTISQVKKLLKRVYFSFEHITKWMEEFTRQVKSAIEYSRKGQFNPRKTDKGRNRVFAQNYKTV